ncbi:MAG: hypothetical protein V4510_09920 [bacterium]
MTATTTEPLDCDGYRKLKVAADEDAARDRKHNRPLFHDYYAKVAWAVERAKHYAEKTGLTETDILNAWEKGRDYWYMNYYQDCNQPLIEGDGVRVFETTADMLKAIGTPAFRCPACDGVSKSPYTCDSGKEMSKGKVCDWKVYGLFTDLGKGVYVFVKAEMRGERIFKPVAWEAACATSS